ncbi:1-acyl-sn-glycerol-3-phosphate acyltransferase [Shinella yambaruensis]|uniref:1-acyl-sn-glycerol-3-phosphate acyltransferase n=1 Tax=Shinella yambaruensis TaxID=415996 RepID=A0ABQ5ZFP7_9HYPH|nr:MULTISPECIES: lysophospholipid acyltransferase family protein [Shinella]MCJ8025820.1 1-acyl-sn-glycerol-3-phosphate acyltransferase [Shinella yambaruensis]MCU7978458.1 1-acyl-sn-glycerol-3-phosphate acyltransferase [Shinella yambaruensis]MCW5707049.1 1-acyl-sn-glycerol-3-phosphate acyltransferase [Shinella sp.]GLR50532.1 1-acyl-sn-glycerol-3-phosphate acyltransferase [Shinella yambaruensis]
MIVWLRLAVAFLVLSTVTAILLPIQLVGLRFNLKVRRRLPRLWHRVACWVLGLRVRVHGTLEAKRPLLLASNHVSWKDILVLGSVADVVYIAKSEVRGWPVFGILARLQATIFVERDQRRKTGDQVDEIARRLTAGEIVVLFPEGTTSDGNRLLEIKTSLFGAAASAVPHAPGGVVHIQPVSIAYTGVHGMAMGRFHRPLAAWPGDIELLPHLLGVAREGAVDVDVDFGERVDYSRSSNRKQVSRTVEARIRAMLGARLRGR